MSNKKECFFAIDLGATSGRTIIGSFQSSGLELEEVNRFPNHLIENGGRFYWDIYELFRNVVEGLRLVARRDDCEICSIGVDTWGVDFVCVGSDGAFLRLPRAYRDPFTAGAAERFFASVPRETVYRQTGIQVMDFNTLFQLDAMRRSSDSALAAADRLLFMPDAMTYMLTGEMVTEYTIASTSQLLNASTRRFEPSLLAAVGLTEDSFGRFVLPGRQVGVLTPEVQRQTGLGPVPVIAVAGHDTASAVAAVPAADRDFAYLSSGTWSLMGIETDAPVISADTQRLNFTNEGGVNGTIRLLKNICGLWILERCRAQWGAVPYDVLIDEACAAEPFRSLINPDEASFSNPSDMVETIRTFCRSHRQPVPDTRGRLVRCIFESLALRYRHVFDSLRGLSERPLSVLHVIGGGSCNELLNQWTANATGVPVVAGPSEATAIGNIMLQAMAAGHTADLASMRRQVRGSVNLKTYMPADTAVWDEAYRKAPFAV